MLLTAWRVSYASYIYWLSFYVTFFLLPLFSDPELDPEELELDLLVLELRDDWEELVSVPGVDGGFYTLCFH